MNQEFQNKMKDFQAEFNDFAVKSKVGSDAAKSKLSELKQASVAPSGVIK